MTDLLIYLLIRRHDGEEQGDPRRGVGGRNPQHFREAQRPLQEVLPDDVLDAQGTALEYTIIEPDKLYRTGQTYDTDKRGTRQPLDEDKHGTGFKNPFF